MKYNVFKRKAYEKLLKWKKESDGRTAVLIEGARRIGKSTLVEQFAKNEIIGSIFNRFYASSTYYAADI